MPQLEDFLSNAFGNCSLSGLTSWFNDFLIVIDSVKMTLLRGGVSQIDTLLGIHPDLVKITTDFSQEKDEGTEIASLRFQTVGV